MTGWFITTLVVLWSLALLLHVYYVGTGKQVNEGKPYTVGDCLWGAVISALVGAGVIFLTPGTLTWFGTLLVAWYGMWVLLDLIMAMCGGWKYPSWWPVVGAVVCITLLVGTLTVGIVVV